jgi:hypothetical protein
MEIGAEPPCCKIPCCNFLCENNKVCSTLGKIGLKTFDDNRAVIMFTLAAFSFLAVIFSAVPVASASFNTTDIKNTCWTYGESDDDDEIWIGLSKVVFSVNGRTETTGWGSADCEKLSYTDDGSFCSDCQDSCLGAVSMVIMNLITAIPNIKGNIERSTRNGDRNCEKVFAVITSTIGFFSTLSAIAIYVDGCQNGLPTSINRTDMTYHTGPGLACLAIATFLQPVNAIGNLLMPVVKPESDMDLRKDLI